MVRFAYLFLEALTSFAKELPIQMPGFQVSSFSGVTVLNYIGYGLLFFLVLNLTGKKCFCDNWGRYTVRNSHIVNALVYMNLLVAVNIACGSSRGENPEASSVWKHLQRALAGAWRVALRKGTGETRKSSRAKQICDGMLKSEGERKREKDARVCTRGLLPLRPFKAKEKVETGREGTSL